MEALYYHLPAIAVSLDHSAADQGHYEEAAAFIDRLVATVRKEGMPKGSILNINIPAHSKGVKVAPMGDYGIYVRGYSKGEKGYQAHIEYPQSNAPGTDYYDFLNSYITITPLQLDMTDYQALELLQAWEIK